MSDDTVHVPGVAIRPLRNGDLEQVAALNAANVPAVGQLDAPRVALFRATATWLVAVTDDETARATVVATFVGLREGVAYGSPNYRWFADRHERFAYVDRIALAPDVRGTGLADALYDRWIEAARDDDVPVVCAEVNTAPPNPRSMAFHERHGFVAVSEEAPYGGTERVAMLQLRLNLPMAD